MKTSIRTALRALPLALAVIAGTSVSPQNVARAVDHWGAPRSVKVSFSDLDLTKPQGAAALYARIRNAARSVCGPVDGHLLEEKAAWTECVNAAIGDAVATVGNANLTNYYQPKTNRGRVVSTAQISKPVEAVR